MPLFNEKDHQWMELALQQALLAGQSGEVPVGAVIVLDDQLVAAAGNSPISTHDPTAHAEINALRQAASGLGNYRLPQATLYATLEPCLMCAGAILHARIQRVVFGAHDAKAGALVSRYTIGSDNRLNHSLNVEGGLLKERCSALLIDFFKQKRQKRRE